MDRTSIRLVVLVVAVAVAVAVAAAAAADVVERMTQQDDPITSAIVLIVQSQTAPKQYR
jgi:uncharacterized protein YcfJ